MAQLYEAGVTKNIVSEGTVVSEHFPFVSGGFVKSDGKKIRPAYHGHVVLDH